MGLLSAVAFDLDGLNQSFEGLREKVARLVPCSCDVCAKAAAPFFFDHADLVRRLDHGRLRVECGASYQEMDVQRLLYQLPGYVNTSERQHQTRTLRIFLASSSELRDDRDAFELYFLQQNHELIQQGWHLKIERWENFLDAMSDTRLQDEYNKAVRASDIFVALFCTKAGKFTAEEFETAWSQFKSSGKPKIFTYFKDAQINPGTANRADLKSLWDFQDKLKALGHFQTNYANIEALKLQFRDQLNKLINADPNTRARPHGA